MSLARANLQSSKLTRTQLSIESDLTQMDDAAFHEAQGGDNHPQPDGCSICLAWSIHVSHGGDENPDPEHCRICFDA